MENANEAIYLGVYTLIFVMALSLTIFLFSSLMSYADEAYDYMHKSNNDGISVNAPVNRHLIITGQEVISYYFNYIKKDKYLEGKNEDNTVLSINLNTKNDTPSYIKQTDLTYKDLIDKIGLREKYILTVNAKTDDTYTYIDIIKATPEEIEEEW